MVAKMVMVLGSEAVREVECAALIFHCVFGI